MKKYKVVVEKKTYGIDLVDIEVTASSKEEAKDLAENVLDSDDFDDIYDWYASCYYEAASPSDRKANWEVGEVDKPKETTTVDNSIKLNVECLKDMVTLSNVFKDYDKDIIEEWINDYIKSGDTFVDCWLYDVHFLLDEAYCIYKPDKIGGTYLAVESGEDFYFNVLCSSSDNAFRDWYKDNVLGELFESIAEELSETINIEDLQNFYKDVKTEEFESNPKFAVEMMQYTGLGEDEKEEIKLKIEEFISKQITL